MKRLIDAASTEDKDAVNDLVPCYESGAGVEKELPKAVSLYEKAFNGGIA